MGNLFFSLPVVLAFVGKAVIGGVTGIAEGALMAAVTGNKYTVRDMAIDFAVGALTLPGISAATRATRTLARGRSLAKCTQLSVKIKVAKQTIRKITPRHADSFENLSKLAVYDLQLTRASIKVSGQIHGHSVNFSRRIFSTVKRHYYENWYNHGVKSTIGMIYDYNYYGGFDFESGGEGRYDVLIKNDETKVISVFDQLR